MKNNLNLSNITQKWIDILMPFSNNYSIKISASELSKKSEVSQQTASRYLNKLAKYGLIDYIKEGRNKLFYFDLGKHTTKIMLNLIENEKSLLFQLKVKEMAVTINQMLNFCESIITFGSYASGTFNKNSDLDLVILGQYNKNRIKKLKRMQIIGINEHYISYSELFKVLDSKNPLSLEIMKNHILFGDVSKVVDIFWRINYEQR